MVTTLQAISGAGYPGVASWDILGNVIPFIGGGEEDKIRDRKRRRSSARFASGGVEAASGRRERDRRRACRCTTGTRCRSSVELEQKPTPEAHHRRVQPFRGRPQELKLPSAPPQPLVYLTERNRPQPIARRRIATAG